MLKATGFGRIEVEPIAAIKELIDINPDAIMFGTDLPSTRAKRPFSEQDIELIQKHFDEETQEKIFYKNTLKILQNFRMKIEFVVVENEYINYP